MLFVATTTTTTGYYEITGKFKAMIDGGQVLRGWLNIGLTVMLLVCVAVILVSAALRWFAPFKDSEGGPTSTDDVPAVAGA
jgi:carbon starvation protein